MLRNILIGIFSAILVVAIGTAAYNVVGVEAQALPAATPYAGNIQSPVQTQDNHDHAAELAAIPVSDLSAEEAAGLLYMYEEEKLARDVYNALYATWNIPTFQNIAVSEQMHMDSVKSLLDRYGLAAPALAPGQFADASLQNLYNDLVAQGNQSAAEALKVGAAIEELDILDLQTRLTQTDKTDIQRVYNSLIRGSNNPLKAFVTALQNQTGEVYQPQYMTVEMYAAALAATQGNGFAGTNGNGTQGTGQGIGRPEWAGVGRGGGQGGGGKP
jgi:hypothetical protein